MDYTTLFITSFVALCAIIDPPGNVGILLSITENDSAKRRRQGVLRGHIYATLILLAFLFAGNGILDFFGLSVDAVRVGGGLILLKIGFDLLTTREETKHSQPEDDDSRTRTDISFFPLAMPLIAGPGSITLVLTYAVGGDGKPTGYWITISSAIGLTMLVSWFMLHHAGALLRVLGKSGVSAITRIMGFLIICIAAQMILIGAERVLSNMPSATKSASAAQPTEELPRVLVFSKTAGYRHPSIARGIACMQEICGDSFEVVASEDGAQFNDENLKQFRAVVFLSTTGDVLDEPQQAAFEHFIRAGGGWVGIHAAADTEYDWPFYQQVVGAAFKSHPAIQEAVVKVASPRHETTKMLPDDWKRRDEWYTYRASPRNTKDMMILAALDESSYTGGDMNGDHPIAWCHSVDKGRAWYTGGGHTDESFDEPLFREHLRAGVNWVMGDTIKKQ